MTQLSKAHQTAIASAVERLATVDALAKTESALRRVFSSDQLQRIATWCKRHGIDRNALIAEIIQAGMAAKGITSTSEGYSVLLKSMTSVGVAGLRSAARSRDGF
jgi:hypothetical protein